MSAVCIIPAKGTSKRIPGKNLRPFFGKPMIRYAIDVAHASGLFDSIWVSTESQEIASVAMTETIDGQLWTSNKCGWINRPTDLAEIEAPDCGTQEVIAHALLHLPSSLDLVCCLYATVPLLTVQDLRTSFEIFITGTSRYVYVNGWYYWGNAEDFSERPQIVGSMELDRLIGERWIDINTPADWNRALSLYSNLHNIPVDAAEVIPE